MPVILRFFMLDEIYPKLLTLDPSSMSFLLISNEMCLKI